MSITTISRSPRQSPNMEAVLTYDATGPELQLYISAKRDLRVCELQGSRRVLEAFGATQPPDFSTRWFADEAEVPEQMIEDVAFTNRVEFRWGCDIPISSGNSTHIVLPAKGLLDASVAHGIWSVVYEHRKFFGFVRETLSFSVAIDARGMHATGEDK
jgi:hypothetical protein